ncbi:MAG: DUF4105 domain-containing protein [Rhodanobacter sp.]|nr:MAG: DUF4105 domain-containing protein [Rhodanobacter sp.]TAM13523.1 MAG: DUF4105 domain-containing protein [Rhodanobacter sp.]TAM35724.1 MAG: DUF4105 domain-containing protein [Rhodanobacter sp.]
MLKAVRTALRIATLTVAALVALLSGAWGALALWYQLPGGSVVRALGTAAWVVLVLALFALVITRRSAWPLVGYVACYGLLLAWWATIVPSGQHAWADDVAHLATGEVHGNLVTVHAVRDFTWRSDSDYDIRWETRQYNLDQLVGADAILSHWGSAAIAHAMLSFAFADGQHLVFSVEIRKRRGQSYSAIGGFFKDFETILVAATERDVVRVRTNVRGEEDYLYPLAISRPALRALFLSYVHAADALARHPTFYNTITSNCTTMVYRMARQLDPGLPWDVRLLLTGYLPGYLYQIGALDHRLTLAQWTARAPITARARATPPDADFSRAIRTPP